MHSCPTDNHHAKEFELITDQTAEADLTVGPASSNAYTENQ